MQFQFSWIYWHLLSSMWSLLKNVLYVLEKNVCTWKECVLYLFCMYLKRMCTLLLLDGMFHLYIYIYMYVYCIWSSTSSKAMFPYWFLSGWSVHWRKGGPLWLLCYCQPLPLATYHLLYVFRGSCLGCACTRSYYIFSLDWSLLCFLLQSLKVCFVFSKYCYLSFLLISIFMEYLFPSPPFQSVCLSSDLKWVSCGQHMCIWVLFFLSVQLLCLFIRIVCPFTFKVVIDRCVLAATMNCFVEVVVHFCSFLL